MHIPALVAGLTAGPLSGMIVGVLSPPLNFVVSGMPPISPPIMPIMALEVGTYGLVSGILMKYTKRGILLCLIGGMLAGRAAMGVGAAVAVAFLGMRLPAASYVTTAIVTGLPGVLIQVILIPILVRSVTYRRVFQGKISQLAG